MMIRYKNNVFICLLFILIIILALDIASIRSAIALSISKQEDILLKADNVSYDKEGLVIAKGNVEISQTKNILFADQVSYNNKTDEVKALGNISFMRDNGDVIFAKELTVQDDMTKGIASYFSARLKDNSLLIAKEAKIVDKNSYKLNKAVYTACIVCNNKNPQWQIKAKNVDVNQQDSQVIYRDAFFEVYGLPIFYTPYFSHATANAPRKSGFMVPKIGYISSIGTMVTVPYYFNISPDKESILAPIMTSHAGIIMTGKYNQLTKFGEYGFDGSITKAQSDRVPINIESRKVIKYHINGKGYFNFSEKLLSGFKLQRSSDKNYLRKYKFGGGDYLTTSLFGEYYNDYNISDVKTLHFQGLTPHSNSDYTPAILPLIESHIETNPYTNNSVLFLDSNILSLTRKKGTHTKRISLTGGWKMPYITRSGHMLNIGARVRGDLYNITNANALIPTFNRNNEYNVTRTIPEIEFGWKLPLANDIKNYKMLLEPRVDIIAAPKGKNRLKIPNEDSIYTEITDSNLFNTNHFAGLDRVEYGSRVNYGLNTVIYGKKDANMELFVGQNYRTKIDSDINYDSGMKTNFSDYVGRVSLNPNQFFNINYRTRIAANDMSIRRHEIAANFYLPKVSFNINYVTLNQRMLENVQQSNKQIFVNTMITINPKWKVGSNIRKNLAKHDKKTISAQGQIIYEGDCVGMAYSVTRDFTLDKAINRKKSVTHFINISLKNLTQ